MAVWDSFSGAGGAVMGWLTTTASWIFIIMVLLLGFFFVLWFRKRRKLNKIVIKHIDLGDGRFDKQTTKGGWFKEKVTLFGLWDYGAENVFKLKDGMPVHNVSHNDYRYFNGKQAIDIVINPHDTKMAFPINKWTVSEKSQSMMAEVAPADYRSSASKAIEQTDLEMQSKWQQYAPMIIVGAVILISLLITLLNTQYGKYMVDKAITAIQEIKSTPCQAVATATGVAP